MSLQQSMSMYKPSSLMPFILSALLFLLYGIINLIEMNGYILNFNVIDVDKLTRITMIYIYMAGYYMFILKLVVYLITLYILTLIVRIIVATIIRTIIPGIKISGIKSGGANEIQYGAAMEGQNKLLDAAIINMRWLLSFILSSSFIILFLIIIPLFLFVVLFTYSKFYNQDNIKNENRNEAPKIMLTHHNFLVYLIVSIFMITFVYSIYMWFAETFKK